ncbi:MAG: SH3 domain-containing protein [Pseudomonadota bacterium]
MTLPQRLWSGHVWGGLAIVALAASFAGATPARAQYQIDCAHGPDTYRVRNVARSDQLNVRSGPRASRSIVGRLPHNASGIVCEGPCEGRWCRVSWRGVRGWVNMRHLGE